MKNNWKTAFWILLILDGVVVLGLLGLYVSFLFPREDTAPYQPIAPKATGAPVFVVSGNKEQLAQILNEELKKELKGNLEASISLKDNVALKGTIKMLNIKIPYTMVFEPNVAQNGEAVILKETSMSLGGFPLPVGDVLQFIKAGTAFPKWVVVDPGQNRLVVHLSAFVIRDQFTIRAKEINLPKNKLVFNIYQTTSK